MELERYSFRLRESNETNAMLDLMHQNDQFKDDAYVGSFWYDPKRDELFGVYSVLAADVPWTSCSLFKQKIKTGRKLHKDIWQKEFHKGRDRRFRGDHTLIPRGRVFQLEDGSFKIMVGNWIDQYPQVVDQIKFEFQLPENAEIVKDVHWDIGHGFTDEFLGEKYVVEKIIKKGNKYQVTSEDGKKNLGTYDTEEEAKRRLQQVHYFKDKDKKVNEDVDDSGTKVEEMSYEQYEDLLENSYDGDGPYGLFYVNCGKNIIAIDNLDGDFLTKYFNTIEEAKRWLRRNENDYYDESLTEADKADTKYYIQTHSKDRLGNKRRSYRTTYAPSKAAAKRKFNSFYGTVDYVLTKEEALDMFGEDNFKRLWNIKDVDESLNEARYVPDPVSYELIVEFKADCDEQEELAKLIDNLGIGKPYYVGDMGDLMFDIEWEEEPSDDSFNYDYGDYSGTYEQWGYRDAADDLDIIKKKHPAVIYAETVEGYDDRKTFTREIVKEDFIKTESDPLSVHSMESILSELGYDGIVTFRDGKIEADWTTLDQLRRDVLDEYEIDLGEIIDESFIQVGPVKPLKEGLSLGDCIKSSYEHFVMDLGETPSVDDLIWDIDNNYSKQFEFDLNDMDSYNRIWEYIQHFVAVNDMEVREDY